MSHRCRRTGLTLLELLIAMSIVVMVLAVLQTVGMAVYDSFVYDEGRGTATQHARVVLDRIARTISQATAGEQFPGVLVVAENSAGHRFPETLVVWHPAGTAAAPDGLPHFNELVIYSPAAGAANQLLEITLPGDARTVPPVSDTIAWQKEIAAAKESKSSNLVVLTELLRQCATSTATGGAWRGAVRFETRLRPSDSDWAAYKAGALEWNRLPWSQGICGSQTGLRQAWVRMELQLTPGDAANAAGSVAQQPITFFGSAAVYCDLHR